MGSIFLFLEVNPTDADIFNGSGTSCKPNKLQPILESSMQKVLREFGFNNSQNETDLTDAAQTQDCPSDWFRILDSCLWVSPPSLVLNAKNATSYCQTKLPNSRLFEPISHVQNTLARELVTALDGVHRHEYIWIGMNDHQHDGRFFYDSAAEPIIFMNWAEGQPTEEVDQIVSFMTREKIT